MDDAERPLPTAPTRSSRAWAAFPLTVFGLVAVGVYVDIRLSLRYITHSPPAYRFGHQGWLEGYARLDSGWYYHIAEFGYFYDGPHVQSAVAFFPAYPLAMRIGALATGNPIAVGSFVTLVAGAGAALLFFRWCSAAFGDRTARLALGLLLLYPFAFYLTGAVYSDALFLCSAIVAFTLVERHHPVLAGVAGIVATASRPVGMALVVGLVLRQLEVRGVIGGSRPALFGADRWPTDGKLASLVPRSFQLGRLRAVDAGVLLATAGFAAFCAYLWWRFDEPFAFGKVADAPGWHRSIDLRTISKVNLFLAWRDFGLNLVTFWLTVQGALTVVGLLLVPAVVRRLGWGYGAYVLVALGIPTAASADFVGMGRYVLAAFPLFVVVADLLHARVAPRRYLRWVPAATLTVSAALLAWMASLYARNYFIS